jgi:hypothetical protein
MRRSSTTTTSNDSARPAARSLRPTSRPRRRYCYYCCCSTNRGDRPNSTGTGAATPTPERCDSEAVECIFGGFRTPENKQPVIHEIQNHTRRSGPLPRPNTQEGDQGLFEFTTQLKTLKTGNVNDAAVTVKSSTNLKLVLYHFLK